MGILYFVYINMVIEIDKFDIYYKLIIYVYIYLFVYYVYIYLFDL